MPSELLCVMPKVNHEEQMHAIEEPWQPSCTDSSSSEFLFNRVSVSEVPGAFALPSSAYMPAVVAFSWVKDPFKACALATFQTLPYHLMLNLAPRRVSCNYSRSQM